MVHSAGIQDRDGGISLLATMKGLFPFLEKLVADSAYQGPLFAKALAKILPHLETEIVKRPDRARGFVQLPRRWIVERTIAWLNRCRRLAKDWENLNRNALAFLKLASIRLMLRRTISAAGGSESSSISIANPQNAAHGMTRRINHPSVGLGIYGALCCVGVAAFAAWMYGLLQPTSAQNPGSSLRPPPLSATGLPPSSRRRRAKR